MVYHGQAIVVLHDSYGELDLRTAAVQHNLGSVHHQLQDLENAEDCFSRAMRTRFRLLGKSHPEHLFSKLKLARVKLEQKDVKAARKHALECSEILNEKGKRALKSNSVYWVFTGKTSLYIFFLFILDRLDLSCFQLNSLLEFLYYSAFLIQSCVCCCTWYFI